MWLPALWWSRPSPKDEASFLAICKGFNYKEKYLGMTSEVPFSADKVQELKRDGFFINHSRVRLGSGPNTFSKAKHKLQNWRHLQLGSISVDPSTQIKVGGKFGIQVHELVAWLINPLEILYITDTEEDSQVNLSSAKQGGANLSAKSSGSSAFAFAGGTLRGHLLAGEERFAVEWNKADDSVWKMNHLFNVYNLEDIHTTHLSTVMERFKGLFVACYLLAPKPSSQTEWNAKRFENDKEEHNLR